jgi:3D (Asp-Asp-Asp) domain-containing protein
MKIVITIILIVIVSCQLYFNNTMLAVTTNTTQAIQGLTDVTNMQTKILVEQKKSLDKFDRVIGPIETSRMGIDRHMIEITAYTASSCGKSPDHPAYGITANGHRLTQEDAFKVAACSAGEYKLNTVVYIAGVGRVTIIDTGAEPGTLDLFVGMADTNVAYSWGRHKTGVAILR